jgi:hypothetical protein
VNTDPSDESPHPRDEIMRTRLTAIENQLDQIDTRLGAISEFNGRLDEIHCILETVIGFVMPDQSTEPSTPPVLGADDPTMQTSGFRVVAHISRDHSGTRLVSDVTWPDMWAVRLFVTALLRNLARNQLAQQHRRCWCEVWSSDEAGQFVDSAILNPDTDAIESESDTAHDTNP